MIGLLKLVLLAVAVLGFALWLAGISVGMKRAKPGAAAALRRIGAVLLVAPGLFYAYIRFIEPNWIRVEQLKVGGPLSEALEGYRVVQLSDLHIDRIGRRERDLIEKVNALRPDWIFLTGDYINNHGDWHDALAVIGRLQAARGIFAVPGNSDNLNLSEREFEEGLNQIGVAVLRNQHAELADSGVLLVGVDDPVDDRDRLDVAMAGAEAQGPKILLAHGPQILSDAVAYGFDLVLSGHTHGGQIGIDAVRRLSDYADRGEYMSGRYDEGRTLLYVNRGIGWKAIPHRFLAWPEITVVDFSRGSATAGFSEPARNSLILSDFETEGEHAILWHVEDAFIQRSRKHPGAGGHSAKVTFLDAARPQMTMEKHIAGNEANSDWSAFGALRFHIANAQPTEQRLFVRVEDAHGGSAEEPVLLAGGEELDVRLDLWRFKDRVNLKRVSKLSFLRQKPGEVATFYIDAIALDPEAAFAEASWGEGAAESAAMADWWLGDFEGADWDQRWETRSISASRVREHATGGQYAVRLDYSASTAPGFVVERYFDKNPKWSNWEGFHALEFDVFNPQPEQERLILQLRDDAGEIYKEDLFIPPQGTRHVEVRLDTVAPYIDIAQIRQFNLFRWRPERESTFFIDSVKLSGGERGQSAETAAAQPAQPKRSDLKVGEDWQVAWVSSMRKVQRDPAQLGRVRLPPVTGALARGEYESFQLVLVGGARPERVRVEIGPLQQSGGEAVIPPAFVRVRRVDYVQTRKPYYPVTYTGAWPDPLIPAQDFDIPAGGVQPVWITLGAPVNLPAGDYEGSITITSTAGGQEILPWKVRVWDFDLPQQSSLATAFDLYPSRLRNTYASAVPGGTRWVDNLTELVKRYYLRMLEHRIWPIIGADPSSPVFGQDVNLFLNRGLGRFGVGLYGGSNGNNWPTDPLELETVMVWYRQAQYELRRMELLDRAYVYAWDEAPIGSAHAKVVLQALKHSAPDIDRLLVLRESPDAEAQAEWLADADIVCLRLPAADPEEIRELKAQGKEVWLYVSGPSHPSPSLVIDYPGLAHRIIPWVVWNTGAEGLLYWCVNFWEGDPWKNPAGFAKDQNGSGALFYPGADGPLDSMRIEILRDGIEDYEYLSILRELFPKRESMLSVEDRDRIRALLNPDLVQSPRSFTRDEAALERFRLRLGEVIEKLSKPPQAAP